MTQNIDRRRLMQTGAGLGLAAATMGFPAIQARAQSRQFAGKTLRILTWSDDTGLAVLRNIAQTFEAKTGCKVIADRTGGTGDMVAKIKAGGARPQYDVMHMAGVGAVTLGAAGLLEKPDLNQLPNLKDVEARFATGADGFAIGYLLWTGGAIYNTKTFKSPPTSYEEMWDPKYAKRVFLPPATWTDALDTIVAAARIKGGSATNAEGGFQKLAALRDSVLTFGENPAQIAELFRSNSLDMGAVYPPAFFAKELRDPTSNMGATYNLKEGFFADLMYTVIPKAHPGESEVANAYINHSLDPVVQGKLAEEVLNGPLNRKAVLSAEASKSPFIIRPEQLGSNAVIHDKAVIAKVRDGWIKRYSQTLS
ncbi:ABC transporter substrate-binding protein [Rhodoferax sp.]|uniref:ABC transporter substrate-binding protein n=1 Tax=Rhodoferax sp. TaxID=50421 RepID=UPI0025F36DF0|nr:ABC transporter substrate-binding protein [Rhodoferax sp.]